METLNFKDFNLFRIGNDLEIIGVLYGNSLTEDVLILLPNDALSSNGFNVMIPNLEQWQQIVRQSDLNEVELIRTDDKGKKIILRKSTRQIETSVMWEVFRRDKYTCRYCGIDNVPLTVDHVVLWEDNGPSIPINLITSCKKFNNARGNMQYEDWIVSPQYLKRAAKLDHEIFVANDKVLEIIPTIIENYMRKNKRSR